MKRRSRAGGEPIKGRRREAQEPKRRSAPKAPGLSNSSPSSGETEVARLTHELSEALERQTATSEVLQIISSSGGDLEPVFATMLGNAARICDAKFGNIFRWDGDALCLVATHNTPPAFVEYRKRRPLPLKPNLPFSRMVAAKAVVHCADAAALPAYTEQRDPDVVAAVELGGIRTFLAVPMLKENNLIGALIAYRQEIRPFSDKQIELVKNFAAQAVIAIENARLLNELRQSLQQQTATAEVLKVISSSPGALEPVFRALLENATQLCGASYGNLYLCEGDGFRSVALHGVLPVAYTERWGIGALFQPGPDVPLARAAKTRQPFQIADIRAGEPYLDGNPLAVSAVNDAGILAVLAVPMLKERDLVGAIVIYSKEARPFTGKQIELLENFASQAVIAIDNARLLNELRQRTTDLTERTADLTEALGQQTATSEVLQIISSSPGDLVPVFQAMLENATRICEAKFGVVFSFDGNEFHVEAQVGAPPEFAEYLNRARPLPQLLPGSHLDRLRQTKRVSYTADYAAEGIPAPPVTLGGARSTVDVPMLKDNELVGAFSIYRQEVRPFTEKQIDLVKNFAAQAVIAIENARLLNELRQSLERQTATSQVLQVISSSPDDLEPVFRTMLENATRICEAKFGVMQVPEGDGLRAVSFHDVPPAYAEAMRRDPVFRPNVGHPLERVASTKQVVHIADASAEQKMRGWIVELAGARTLLLVPMLKDNKFVGVISIYRQEVRPFTDKQIELVKNFAAQAVIAIENARLLNELRQRTAELTGRTADLTEALEQRTATSEVLEVISGSPGDLQPVFETMLDKAVHICDAGFGNIFRWDGEAIHLVATHGTPPAFAEARRRISPNPINPKTSLGRMVVTKAVVHVADAAAEPGYLEEREPAAVAAVELGGVRTALFVPMLKEGELIGAFTLSRQEVRPFTDKQIELVQNFAAQAVIAIENARLLKELRERTDQLETQSQELEKLNQQLEQRVADQVDEIERMSRLRRFLPPQVADLIVASGSEKQLESHRREITALFCDLRGFTGFTESADAEDVMALLRDYHAAIGEIIIKYNGTLERYAGDGVMVVFNDPVPVENPALQAVLMALEVRDAIGALTETWRRLGHDIGFGIGIAHGFATLGTIGFEGRFDYAAIGTVSNVASRLCDEAKPGQILISPRVLTKVENAVKVEPVGEFELKGIRRPLAAYNVLNAL